MNERYRDRIPLLFPPLVACATDVAMTMFGQPAAYWSGHRGFAEDFNPVARILLELHPAAFPLAAAMGFALLTAVLLTWRNHRLAYVLAFCVTFAQGVAAAGWMIRFGPAGWLGAAMLLVVLERLLALASRDAVTLWRTPRTSPADRRP